METLSDNIAVTAILKNRKRNDFGGSNAHILIDVLRNISSVLEDIRIENDRRKSFFPIPSRDAYFRQKKLCCITRY